MSCQIRTRSVDIGTKNGAYADFGNYVRRYPTRWANVRASRVKECNFGLFKNFKAAERFKAQLRGEFFNSFNHPRFGGPETNPGSSSFGRVTPSQNNMPRVVQIALKPEIDLTFAAGLRSILRGDPNVIMVGEMRDLETTEIAIRGALTGHLVFSTLHTNDAVGGISRLLDMGIEPFLIASSVRAFLAQRLVRRLCQIGRAPV